jgi:hypothetical protein
MLQKQNKTKHINTWSPSLFHLTRIFKIMRSEL